MQCRLMIRLLISCILIATGARPVAAAARDHLKQPEEWFHTASGRERLKNLLSYQDSHGCWPKNVDTTETPYRGSRKDLHGTFDNSATVNELRLLGRACRATGDDRYKEAFLRGLRCILDAQYSHGGWPQYPDASGYSQHITFNDDTMVGLMTLLREVSGRNGDQKHYSFVSSKIRTQAGEAFDRGIQCILACQISVNGKKTVWSAQQHRESLEPRGARSYEHPSLSGGESAPIVCLLMSLKDPSDEVRRSIRGAVEWYRRSALTGIRLETQDGDRRVVRDPDAPALWARFYELQTNRPIFSGRDGVIRYTLSEIERERRTGYSWYVTSGRRVEECWSKWKTTTGRKSD